MPSLRLAPWGALAAIALTAPSVLAQAKTIDLPVGARATTSDDRPLGSASERYQLWFSANEWILAASTPFRIDQMQWFGAASGAPAGSVDLEIRMANSQSVAPSPQFDDQFLDAPVTVFPRQNLVLPALAPGAPVTITFASEFVWDGESGVVVDVRVFGNGNNNTRFAYNLGRVVGVFTRAAILSAPDPNARFALRSDAGQALVTRFSGNEGVTTSFGSGCPGAGNFVPRARQTGGYPRPALQTFAWEVDRVPGGVPCTLYVGESRDDIGTGPGTLPLDLGRFGFAGCALRVRPTVNATVLAAGGGAGAATARVAFAIPPFPNLIGVSFYSQWIIVDRSLASPVSTSQGLWHQFGM